MGIVDLVVFFLIIYPFGILVGLVFWSLVIDGVLEMRGWENFPKQKSRIVVVSNHPSLVEPILMLGLFFHLYWRHPLKYGTSTLADRKNYYDNWKYRPLRLKIIPVDRTVGKSDVRGLILARKAISRGANIVLFPEGGRTFKGTKNLQSKTGKELRPLKGGFALLAAELGVVLVPVWFEFKGWRCMRLTVGEPKNFHGVLRGEIVKETEKILLELADKTD